MQPPLRVAWTCGGTSTLVPMLKADLLMTARLGYGQCARNADSRIETTLKAPGPRKTIHVTIAAKVKHFTLDSKDERLSTLDHERTSSSLQGLSNVFHATWNVSKQKVETTAISFGLRNFSKAQSWRMQQPHVAPCGVMPTLPDERATCARRLIHAVERADGRAFWRVMRLRRVHVRRRRRRAARAVEDAILDHLRSGLGKLRKGVGTAVKGRGSTAHRT
eukprot:6175732-Pleurochrysis_carterae.AAC.4